MYKGDAMGRAPEELRREKGARLDRELLAVQGLYTCPACWAGDEVCDSCGGSGLVSVGGR
jgi:hypothetical protein